MTSHWYMNFYIYTLVHLLSLTETLRQWLKSKLLTQLAVVSSGSIEKISPKLLTQLVSIMYRLGSMGQRTPRH